VCRSIWSIRRSIGTSMEGMGRLIWIRPRPEKRLEVGIRRIFLMNENKYLAVI
jgi:hypothetical protein